MNDLQWYDVMRLLTAALALVVVYRLGHRVNEDHKTYSVRLREYVWVIGAVLLVQFTGALEQTLHDTGYRYSGLLSFFIVLALLRATRKSDEPLQHTN